MTPSNVASRAEYRVPQHSNDAEVGATSHCEYHMGRTRCFSSGISSRSSPYSGCISGSGPIRAMFIALLPVISNKIQSRSATVASRPRRSFFVHFLDDLPTRPYTRHPSALKLGGNSERCSDARRALSLLSLRYAMARLQVQQTSPLNNPVR